MSNMAQTIRNACDAAQISQRELAGRTGISQSTLNRILIGEREAKMPEVILIADAVGCTVAELTGTGVSARVQVAARATNGANMETMRQRLLHFMELDAYLDDYGIPTA